ncbi:ABC transporter permease [Actinopolymorpha sp. B9G3]|uniref:ABC transporter permease n=1 Tax=Actinopolymorpha sp. B9G3 TaxID=3158970 RepID=UPI0032D91BDB
MATSSTAELEAAKPPHSGGKLHSAAKLLGVALLVPLAVAGMLSLFAWPSANLEPRDLPLGVAGPAQATDALSTKLEQASEGGFEIHQYADEAAARSAIEDREVYGAIVTAPDGITLLTASAASPLVAQLLTQAVTTPDGPLGGAGAQTGADTQAGGNASAPPKVVDVVPTTRDDPRGTVLSVAVLPLVFAGIATGIATFVVSRPGLAQATGLLVTSALAGVAAVWVAQEWLGALGGDWWVNAGAIGLTVLAISATVAGLGAAIGPAGLGLAAFLMMFVGNPFSGVASAPELLPSWVGVTGQFLPPGAGGSLLRSTAFFDSAAATQPGLVLAGWVVLGLACGLIGVRRHRAARTTT